MLESALAFAYPPVSSPAIGPVHCSPANTTPRRVRTRHKPLTAAGILVVLLFSVLATHPALGLLPHRGPKEMHREIETIESQWRQANLDNDVAAIDSLLADDYLAVTANGTLQDKAQTLAQRKAGSVHFERLDISDQKIRIYGDTAVVTSKAEVAGMNGGQPVDGHYRYTRVYNRRLGKWKIVGFQASEIHDRSQRH